MGGAKKLSKAEMEAKNKVDAAKPMSEAEMEAAMLAEMEAEAKKKVDAEKPMSEAEMEAAMLAEMEAEAKKKVDAEKPMSEAEMEAAMLAEMEAETKKKVEAKKPMSEAEMEAAMLAEMEAEAKKGSAVINHSEALGPSRHESQNKVPTGTHVRGFGIKPKFLTPIAVVIILSQFFLAVSIIDTAKTKQQEQAEVFIAQLHEQMESQTKVIRESIDKKAQLLMELIKEPAAKLIFNYDEAILADLAKSVQIDKDILDVNFLDEDNKSFLKQKKLTLENATHRKVLEVKGEKVGTLLLLVDYSSIDIAVKNIKQSISTGVEKGQQTTKDAVEKIVTDIAIFAVFGIGILIFVTWLFLTRLIANPLIFAQKFAGTIMSGNLEDQHIPFHSKDEIGLLLNDLDGMRISLKGWIDNLDSKVAEKTAQVTKSMARIEKGMKELEGDGMNGVFESLSSTTTYLGNEVAKIQDKVFVMQEIAMEIDAQIPKNFKEKYNALQDGINDIISLTMMGDLSKQKLDNIQRQLKEIRNYVLALLGEEGEDLSGINFDRRIDKVGLQDDSLDIDALLKQYGT